MPPSNRKNANMPSLNGAVVLVTGANGGIGTHFVHDALARGAAKVYATARTPRTWEDERIVPLTLDVTDPVSIDAAVAAAPDVTVLINNAGANPPSASLLDVTEADIRANMETNFFGPVFLARAFAPILAAKPGSTLVDVHSVASWYAFGGIYSASKAALWSATNSLRIELAPKGVHVTGVHMGYVDTPMAAHADGPKMLPAQLVTTVYEAVEAGAYEVLADELTAQVKAALSGPVEALYPDLHRTDA
jgi:NAD(P)-dependent dehydrogenase (short-subunit alcohol dehydrogenase family)